MAAPRIHYARTREGIRIAWCEYGEGAPAVFRVANYGPGVGLEEVLPRYFEAVANQRYRLILYDPRGVGLSQRPVDHVDERTLVDDAEAVLGSIDAATLVLNAPGEPMATATALKLLQRHPGIFTHLVLYAPYASHAEFKAESRLGRAAAGLRELDWETRTDVVEQLLRNPDNPWLREQGGAHLRESTDAHTYHAYRRLMQMELTDEFARVTIPTLVVGHTRGPVPVELSQGVAALIPGSRYVQISDPTWVEAIEAEVEFFGTARPYPEASPAPSALRTILFTDLEGHSAIMSRLGDAKGRELLREHERLTRAALHANGGTEVKSMGDGFMASFGSAQAALECARAIQTAFAEPVMGEALKVRMGINAGEPVADGDDLFGASVIAAARIAARAAGGQVLVANVVRELVAGKGFLFHDTGQHELKGLEEPVRIWELRLE